MIIFNFISPPRIALNQGGGKMPYLGLHATNIKMTFWEKALYKGKTMSPPNLDSKLKI